MRGRLDEEGKRYGKLIEYRSFKQACILQESNPNVTLSFVDRLSELRMIELLEGLCDVCRHYTWGYRNPNDGTPLQIGWVHVDRSKEISIRYRSLYPFPRDRLS